MLLTDAQRMAQVQLGARVVGQLDTAWPILDPRALDATTMSWLEVVTPMVRASHAESVSLA